MISREFFESALKASCLLFEKRPTREWLNSVYSKIANNFDEEDLELALDEITEDSALSYPSLMRALRKYQSRRIEAEQLEAKRQEEAEAKEFWRKNYSYIKEGACDRQCYACQVVYCDIVAKHSIQAVRDILAGKITGTEANKKLASMFHGIGFEQDTEHPF